MKPNFKDLVDTMAELIAVTPDAAKEPLDSDLAPLYYTLKGLVSAIKEAKENGVKR
jgi:hypothetical protein